MASNKSYLAKGNITKNFALWEFCNSEAKEDTKIVISPEFIEHVQMLQQIRNILRYPMNVSSGYRTVSYNKSCGGDKNSAHLDGLATDFKGIPQTDYQTIAWLWTCVCEQHNKIGGINYYTNGIHLCSNEDRFGNTKFVIRDYRGTDYDW